MANSQFVSHLLENARKEERKRGGEVAARTMEFLATHISDSGMNGKEAAELLRTTAEAIRNEVREQI